MAHDGGNETTMADVIHPMSEFIELDISTLEGVGASQAPFDSIEHRAEIPSRPRHVFKTGTASLVRWRGDRSLRIQNSCLFERVYVQIWHHCQLVPRLAQSHDC